MTPSATSSNAAVPSLSRARSVPLAAAASEAASMEAKATGSFEATGTSANTGITRHYTVVATDCRRWMLSSTHSNDLTQRRASGLSGSGSSECQTIGESYESFVSKRALVKYQSQNEVI